MLFLSKAGAKFLKGLSSRGWRSAPRDLSYANCVTLAIANATNHHTRLAGVA